MSSNLDEKCQNIFFNLAFLSHVVGDHIIKTVSSFLNHTAGFVLSFSTISFGESFFSLTAVFVGQDSDFEQLTISHNLTFGLKTSQNQI